MGAYLMTTLAIIAALVTVLYAVSALGRIVPVKRRHHSWRQVGGMSAITLMVLGVAGCAYGVTTAKRSQPSSDAEAAIAASGSKTTPSGNQTVTGSGNNVPIGVFAPGEWNSWSPVQQFSQQAGQAVRYVLDYLGPDEQFPVQLGKLAAQHDTEPVLQLQPTMSMADIAAGRDDAYLHSLARQVSGYGYPVMLSFAPEANGDWYQYGWTRTPPAQYQAAWKHVMAEFSGVRNVTWMETVNINYHGSGPLADYIVPGVMIGIDGYYGYPSGHSFESVFGSTLAQVRAKTHAPVMISETAILGSTDQAADIPNLIQGVRQNHLAGLIWFNQDKGQGQDWPLTPAGAAALRASLARP
jgi:hypothetical protein